VSASVDMQHSFQIRSRFLKIKYFAGVEYRNYASKKGRMIPNLKRGGLGKVPAFLRV